MTCEPTREPDRRTAQPAARTALQGGDEAQRTGESGAPVAREAPPQAMTHVVALSGGKDSTAMALRLAEVEPREYVYICTPTGRELPEMEAHWSRLETLLGAPLLRVTNGSLGDSCGFSQGSRASTRSWLGS